MSGKRKEELSVWVGKVQDPIRFWIGNIDPNDALSIDRINAAICDFVLESKDSFTFTERCERSGNSRFYFTTSLKEMVYVRSSFLSSCGIKAVFEFEEVDGPNPKLKDLKFHGYFYLSGDVEGETNQDGGNVIKSIKFKSLHYYNEKFQDDDQLLPVEPF